MKAYILMGFCGCFFTIAWTRDIKSFYLAAVAAALLAGYSHKKSRA